jgi:hypothetical protein
MLYPLSNGGIYGLFNLLFMFKVYNHRLQKEELVEKIDLNKHWQSFGVPFDSIPKEEVKEETEETPIEEIIVAVPKTRGRPFNK